MNSNKKSYLVHTCFSAGILCAYSTAPKLLISKLQFQEAFILVTSQVFLYLLLSRVSSYVFGLHIPICIFQILNINMIVNYNEQDTTQKFLWYLWMATRCFWPQHFATFHQHLLLQSFPCEYFCLVPLSVYVKRGCVS